MANKPDNKKNKTKRLSRLKRFGQSRARRLADSSLPEILFVSTFILSRWLKNSDFSYPSELAIPLIIFAVLASIIFYSYRYIFGPGLAAHVAALLLTYCFYAYSFIQSSAIGKNILEFLPDSWTALVNSLALAILLALACGLAGWLASKIVAKIKHVQQLQPYKVLLFAVVFIFAFQLIKTANRLLEMQSELRYSYPHAQLQPNQSDKKNKKPDIYYLVFDRYANAETLANIYNYDNKPFLDGLSSQDFVNKQQAYANYPFTMSSISSTLSMNYLPEFEQKFGGNDKWQTAFPYRSILNNPPVARLLKQDGYKYNQISSWWDFTRVGIEADAHPTRAFVLNTLGTKHYLSDLQRDVINKSILSPWLSKGISIGQDPIVKYELTLNPQQNFESQITAIKNLADRADRSVPQFSFAHILVPHDPYIFDAEGNTPTYDSSRTDNGVDETVKYKNQLTYLNKRITELTSFVRLKSPDSVIVIQADEGPYPKEFRPPLNAERYYDPINLEIPQMKQKFGIFASYYLPGVETNELLKAGSSVNTFRLVLNKYLGYDLPLLPDCYLSNGNKYTVFDYQIVNKQLTGKEAPECELYD